jgi:hypothetical protein
VFEAATGRGSDEAFDRRLGGTLGGSAELFGTCRSRRADEPRDQLADMCRQVGLYAAGLLKGAKHMDVPVLHATRFEL